jgi:hypothetical protein
LKRNGSIVTWGHRPRLWGPAVQDQLRADVQRVACCARGAFAALKSDGSLVTWGDSRFGGDLLCRSSFRRTYRKSSTAKQLSLP